MDMGRENRVDLIGCIALPLTTFAACRLAHRTIVRPQYLPTPADLGIDETH